MAYQEQPGDQGWARDAVIRVPEGEGFGWRDVGNVRRDARRYNGNGNMGGYYTSGAQRIGRGLTPQQEMQIKAQLENLRQ
jgi:hypothetical protein